jgi:putative serine protease PepD
MTSTNPGPDDPGHGSDGKLGSDGNLGSDGAQAPVSTRTWSYDPAQPAPAPRGDSWNWSAASADHHPSDHHPADQDPAGQHPGGPPPGQGTPVVDAGAKPPRRGRTVAGMAAVAVVAAVVGGGVGGYIGHQTATPSGPTSVGTLQQPVPEAGDEPPAAITSVAQHVLPSVVQLSKSSGEGSGVVLSGDGLILTNAHVVDPGHPGKLTAVFQNGSTSPVTVVGIDARADLAVVRAQGMPGLTPIQLGNSDGLQVGQQVVAVGSPLGLAGTVTSGIVSSLNRPVETGDPGAPDGRPASNTSVLDAIQTDAAINPGNSGGPLVDMQGRIVGINSAIASLGSGGDKESGSIGLGFAIPINQAKRIADELIATGHATRAALGVLVRDADPAGAQLVNVIAGGAGAQAGLKPGDVVTKIGNRLVQDSDDLVAAVNSANPGSSVALAVSSGGAAPRQVQVTLGSVPADQ